MSAAHIARGSYAYNREDLPAGACGRQATPGRGLTGYCRRPRVPGEGACRIHLAADRRGEEAREAERERQDAGLTFAGATLQVRAWWAFNRALATVPPGPERDALEAAVPRWLVGVTGPPEADAG